jgi:uncharacterized membrane protein YqjE
VDVAVIRKVAADGRGRWTVRRPRAQRASALFSTREDALANARASVEDVGGGTVIAPPPTAGSDRVTAASVQAQEHSSVGVGDVAHDVASLVRAEFELAKAELRDETRSIAIAVAFSFVAISLAVAGLLALVWACAWALAEVVAPGASFAIVAVAALATAAVSGGAGLQRLRRVDLLPRTRAIAREKLS